MDNSKVFVCYSVPLMKHLTNNGIRYEVVGLHTETKNTFWVFIKSKKLNEMLIEWKSNNPNK